MLKAILRTAAILGVVLAGTAAAVTADDLVVWRPSTGTWYATTSSGTSAPAIQWGSQSAGDRPLMADVDGDGVRDLIVWRGTTGSWFVLTSSTGYSTSRALTRTFGAAGDVPLLGDVDGDGKADLLVWRPSSGTFYWLTSSSGYARGGSVQWGSGTLGDVPLTGDFDGDGRSDLAVWRPSNGTWYWLTSTSGYAASLGKARQWGVGGLDIPKTGDVDGDGRDDLMVWRGSTGMWYWLTAATGYSPSAAGSVAFGSQTLGDVPLVADLDGDRRADLTVWRPVTGMWYWLRVAGLTSAARQWGSAADVPVVFTRFRNNGAFPPASAPTAPTSTPTPAPPPPPPTSSPTGGVQLRVLQWNTHHGGYGTDGVYSTDRIASWAAAMQPDVILFNEIERNTGWGHEDQPEVYRRLMQQKTGRTWYALFAQEFGNWDATGKGNLILSTYPIQASDRYELVHNADRSIGMATIAVNGRPITLISTHLDPYDATLRLTQASEVTTWSAAQPENRIITGDMNAWPDQTSIAHFNQTYNDSWTVASSLGTAIAFSGNTGQTKNGRIDYIFYSKNSPNLVVKSSQVYDTRDSSGVMPSDHRPVLTTFVVR